MILNLSQVDVAEQHFFEKLQTILYLEELGHSYKVHRICGVDASYKGDDVVAVASVVNLEGEMLEQARYEGHATYPYVRGLFFLREGPFVTEAVKKLAKKPDLVCFDAHGLAHPRYSGLATICGMILGISSIGISKSRLVGDVEVYKSGLDRLVYRRKNVGFVTEKPRRFWSPGFSVSMLELESMIVKYGTACVGSILKSHQAARKS